MYKLTESSNPVKVISSLIVRDVFASIFPNLFTQIFLCLQAHQLKWVDILFLMIFYEKSHEKNVVSWTEKNKNLCSLCGFPNKTAATKSPSRLRQLCLSCALNTLKHFFLFDVPVENLSVSCDFIFVLRFTRKYFHFESKNWVQSEKNLSVKAERISQSQKFLQNCMYVYFIYELCEYFDVCFTFAAFIDRELKISFHSSAWRF